MNCLKFTEMQNKVFDEQALLWEIERVFGKFGSHVEIYRTLLTKLDKHEQKYATLFQCIRDIKTTENHARIVEAIDELDKIDNDE